MPRKRGPKMIIGKHYTYYDLYRTNDIKLEERSVNTYISGFKNCSVHCLKITC